MINDDTFGPVTMRQKQERRSVNDRLKSANIEETEKISPLR